MRNRRYKWKAVGEGLWVVCGGLLTLEGLLFSFCSLCWVCFVCFLEKKVSGVDSCVCFGVCFVFFWLIGVALGLVLCLGVEIGVRLLFVACGVVFLWLKGVQSCLKTERSGFQDVRNSKLLRQTMAIDRS